ncbi:DUF4435 domain-containing protein [Candidatus Haliotispira prima]|uniref:DUF4435 domain-containing protein n=1 Tax=Candidatus Haliotispira prima TaxID=3034016 RepID=A0ABY8MLV6_9SPIO|nr:DUF4435 domain-containing protein [Candidatus Haliotispira prima]
MLELHKKALESKVQICLHKFKCNYKRDSKVIYGFCEGKSDLSFYKGPIGSYVDNNWEIELLEVGGFDNVVELFGKIDWRTYDKSQVVFFIDRDLTEFTGVKLPNESNVYITDNYSIENDVVNWNTCERVLTEILGFTALSVDDKTEIKDLFNVGLTSFIKEMVPVMSWIVSWQKKKRKAYLKNIEMKHLFKIKEGELKPVLRPGKQKNVTEYIHRQCSLEIDAGYFIEGGCAEFCEKDRHLKFTRGKYLLWFLTEFCLSVHRDCLEMPIIKSVTTQPKNSTNFSHSRAVIDISTRCRAPESLKKFLSGTVKVYVAQKDAV